MTVQLVAVIAIIALTAAYVARATWRTWSGRKVGCASGCGKCAAPASVPEQKGRISLPQV